MTTTTSFSAHRSGRSVHERTLGSWLSAVSMEATKIVTMRSVWLGLLVVAALTAYFACNGVILARESLPSLQGGVLRDDMGAVVPLDIYVGDMILSAPYQSMMIFFPLLLVLVCGRDYRSERSQLALSFLAVPAGSRRAVARIVVATVAVILSTALVFTLSDVILVLTLPDEARAIIVSAAGLLRCLRIMLIAWVVTMMALAVTTLTRSTLGGAVLVILHLVIGMSGLLRVFGRGADSVLPLIAGKTFLFGYQQEAGNPSVVAGVLILAAWAGASVLTIVVLDARRQIL